MAYKLIIADDEPKLIDLIRLLGHWKELEIEIIDECKNGKEALNSIIQHEPDIALLDIMMPVYDGITIIEKAKSLGLNTVFIIISGYRHFEYAKSAIGLGVIDYLLKPLDETNLNATLQKACNFVSKEKSRTTNDRILQALSEQNQTNALSRLWKYTLSALKSPAPEIALPEILPYVSIPLESPLLMCVSIKSNVDNLLTNSGSLFEDKLVAFMRQTLGNQHQYIYHCDISGLYAILALKAEKQLPALTEPLNLLSEKICQLYEIYGPFNFRIGYSYTRLGPERLPETMLHAQAAMLNAPSHTRVCFAGDSHTYPISKARILSEQELLNLQRSIQFLDKQGVGDLFKIIHARVDRPQAGSIPTTTTLRFLHDTLCDVYRHFYSENTFDCSQHMLCILAQENFSLEDVIEHVKNDILQLMDDRIASQETHQSQTIQKAERYIRAHYTNAISLEDVAAEVGLSSNYFSKLFKQQLNVGFSTYLTNIRLETAQKLLIETNLSIKAIAERIGYPDEKYLQKLFKKQIGVTPSEYRKLFQ